MSYSRTNRSYASGNRRELRATAFWLLLVLAAGAVWWWYEQRADDTAGTPAPAVSAPPADAQPVVVNFPLDGDSLEVVAQAPGKVLPDTETTQIRLLGIDAPEMHAADGGAQCWAESARDALKRLAPPGGKLWILGDVEPRDKFDRYLTYAWTSDGRLVNALLAEQGAVRELAIPPNTHWQPLLHEKIEEAKAAHRGLWGTCVG